MICCQTRHWVTTGIKGNKVCCRINLHSISRSVCEGQKRKESLKTRQCRPCNYNYL